MFFFSSGNRKSWSNLTNNLTNILLKHQIEGSDKMIKGERVLSCTTTTYDIFPYIATHAKHFLISDNNEFLNWYIFLNEKNNEIFVVGFWLWKYNCGTFWGPGFRYILKIQQFPCSMLIFGQKSCFLGPPKVEIQ